MLRGFPKFLNHPVTKLSPFLILTTIPVIENYRWSLSLNLNEPFQICCWCYWWEFWWYLVTGVYIHGLDTVGGLVFVGGVWGGAVVIDGNGDGIWWQVLAVAFCGHWAGGGSSVGAASKLRLCDTPPLGMVTPATRRLGGTKQQTGMRPTHPTHDDAVHKVRPRPGWPERAMHWDLLLSGKVEESRILQLAPSCRFIHPFSTNNLSIESGGRGKILRPALFCVWVTTTFMDQGCNFDSARKWPKSTNVRA